MGTSEQELKIGTVVLVAFPYADFTRLKNRPALVVGEAEFGNLILCQITSRKHTSKRAISLRDADFRQGGLRVKSYIRPDKLFTVELSIIQGTVGALKKAKLTQVKTALRKFFE